MTKQGEAVLKEALELELDERAELIDLLIKSFENVQDERLEALWAEEVESRLAAYEAGKMTADSEAAVFERISRR